MIKVRCRTTIDEHKGKDWPKEMVCRPLKGDKVRASCGMELVVVSVTHAVGSNNSFDIDINGVPGLVVELHRNYPGLGGG